MSGKGFVCLSLDIEQAKEIAEIFKIAGVKCLTPEDFHVTLMQDESDPEIEVLKTDKEYTAKVTGVQRLGKSGSDWEAIVLDLESDGLNKRHQELLNAGFNHKFPSYKCHMSILYKPNDTDLDLVTLIYNLGVLPEELKFSNEQVKETI